MCEGRRATSVFLSFLLSATVSCSLSRKISCKWHLAQISINANALCI